MYGLHCHIISNLDVVDLYLYNSTVHLTSICCWDYSSGKPNDYSNFRLGNDDYVFHSLSSLHSNSIGREGATALGDALQHCTNLQHLE